jgi:SlyX protein
MSEESQVELEIKLTYMEETVGELNKIVYQQQKTIDLLTETLKKLTDQMKSVEERLPQEGPANERPPHY